MSGGISKCSKIRHIVRIRQMLRRWRNKAALRNKLVPSDVPAGHVAVIVGISSRRFIVRATYLNHPLFQKILSQTAEEFGFSNNVGPLCLPDVEESLFEEILRFLQRSESKRFSDLDDFRRYCHVGFRSGLNESRPLLEKSVW